MNSIKFDLFSVLDISNFKYHLAHHGNDRPYLCNECPKNCKDFVVILYCDKYFLLLFFLDKTRIDLLQHQRVHDKQREPFRCQECGQVFRTRSNFNTHLRTHTVKGPQHCDICNKLFVNLRSHVQQVHQKLRTHPCHLCDKTFGKKSGLDRHILTVHEKMRNYYCDLCQKSFGEKAQLLRHRKIHFKSTSPEPDSGSISEDQEIIEDKKRYKCGRCKKILNSRAALKRHRSLVHLKERNFLCNFCPKKFGEKSNLMRHIMKAHANEMGSSRTIKQNDDEDEEKFTEQKASTSEVNTQQYPCSHCSKILGTNWGLKAHEDICRLKQQKKLNEKNDDHAMEFLQDLRTMEQVFLVSEKQEEQIEIKEESPFDDTNVFDDDNSSNSNESYSKFIPEIVDDKAVQIKDEPLELQEDTETVLKEFSVELIKLETSDINMDSFASEIKEECNVSDVSFDSCDDRFESSEDEQTTSDTESSDSNEEGSINCELNDDLDTNRIPVQSETSNRFNCKLCSSTFKEKRYFFSHWKTVHVAKKTVKCEYCPEVFTYRSQRLRHTRTLHPEVYEDLENPIENSAGCSSDVKKEYECELCLQQFHKKESLEQHLELGHEGDKVERTCEFCQKVFKKSKYLLLHLRAVHSANKFICKRDNCGREFSFQRSLQRHIKTIHDDISDFPCTSCSKAFRCKYELQQHIIGHHDADKSDRKCTDCGKIFKKSRYMQIHRECVHRGAKMYDCPICKRSFSFKRSMERHVKAIHEDKRDYNCDICDKAFRSRYDVNEHYNNIHAVIKKMQPLEKVTCDLCDKVCSSRKSLYTHRKMKHEGVRWGIKFECKLCKEIFPTKYKKSKHWIQVHRNGEIKMRKCNFCNTDFQLHLDFKTHIESHAGCFICMICGYNFIDSSELFMHEETHRKIDDELRRYVCDSCGHKLATKAQLQVHMRKHVGNYEYVWYVNNYIN